MTRPRPGRVYAIADAEALGGMPLAEAVAAMAEAGVCWVQVRAKRLSGRDFFSALEACCRAVEGSGCALWVDDRADLAALFAVAGIHVGQADLPPAAVRRVVGKDLWIGWSVHDAAQLAAADEDPDVDLVAVGPVFATTGKADPDPVVGVQFVRQARERTAKPLVAIGGIGAGNAAEVLAAGADAVAVLGAVCRGRRPDEVKTACRRLLAAAAG